MIYRCCCRKFLDSEEEFRNHLENCPEAWEFLRVLRQLKKAELKLNDGSLFSLASDYT